MTHFYVYIVECKDGTYYTGYAKDIKQRLKEHNGQGAVKGAKYTSGRRPVRLRYLEEHSDRSSAMKREYEIKQLDKAAKKTLLASANKKAILSST